MLCAQDGAKAATLTMKRLEKFDFGRLPDGSTAHRFTMRNSKGMTIKATDYGCIITEILVPDKNGKIGDVVLGFDNLDQYLKGHPFFGAIAGRYANRIARAKCSLDGKEYTLAANNGKNHLHGGKVGFDKKLWNATDVSSANNATVEFRYTSKDMEEGYPGNLA
ncbi:MAG TPA: galactose-1-epimerase, partial [Verrucomicrobiae bacterium]